MSFIQGFYLVMSSPTKLQAPFGQSFYLESCIQQELNNLFWLCVTNANLCYAVISNHKRCTMFYKERIIGHRKSLGGLIQYSHRSFKVIGVGSLTDFRLILRKKINSVFQDSHKTLVTNKILFTLNMKVLQTSPREN